MEVDSCLIDIFYDDKKYRVKYPQIKPNIITIQTPFKRDRISVQLSLLIPKGKKYRKLAKGELNIYKKYLFNPGINFDKWIYLSTYQNQLNITSSPNESSIYPGKINVNCQFLDPEQTNEKTLDEDEKDILSPSFVLLNTKLLKNVINSIPKKEREQYNTKNKSQNINLTEILSKLNVYSLNVKLDENDEERLALENENEFDDDLSDVSISLIEDEEDEKMNEIDTINTQVDGLISKLKKYFDDNSDEIFPDDSNQLRGLLESLTSEVKTISETYSQNLQSMSNVNKKLKVQAKDYYEKYKELKSLFDKERREYQTKCKEIKEEKIKSEEEKMKIGKEISDVKNELNTFQKKLGMSQNNKDDETEIMIDILKSLKEKGVNIFEGLSKEQIEFINEVLNDEQVEDVDEDTNKYIIAIETIVNELYSNKLISEVKIEEIETNEYIFNDKKACLMFDENNTLKCIFFLIIFSNKWD